MSVMNVIWILLFWGMQVVANLLFKWGSLTPENWIKGFVGGHLFGVTSAWFMMILYKSINPNVVFGICFGGAFFCVQIAIARVFHSELAISQYIGIIAIVAGILLLANGPQQA